MEARGTVGAGRPGPLPLLGLLLISGSAILAGLLISWLNPAWSWEQVPFHSFIETLGGVIALSMALTLLRFRSFTGVVSTHVWVASALVGMGVFDAFHAVVHTGMRFVWFHSLSNFVGGMLFASVWIPERISGRPNLSRLPLIVLATAIVLGCGSLAFPEAIPAMKADGGFTDAAKVLNLVGGIGFVAAAIYFILPAGSRRIQHAPVLANHCLLFGLSGLLFEYSTLWDGVWWEWHLLRLAAYGFIFYFFILTYRHERDQAELRLRVSEERYALAMKGSDEGVWDWNLKTGEIYLSPCWKSMLGYAENEFEETPQAMLQAIAEEDRALVEERLAQYKRGDIDSFEVEARMRHRQGRWVHVLCRALLVRDPESGDPVRLVGTQQDITARKLAEEELHKLSQAVQHGGEAVIITDAAGAIEYVNRAFTAITGYDACEVLGKNPRILKSDAQDPAFYTEMWETISRGETWSGTLIDRKKDGSYYPAMLSVSPIKNRRGEITHYVSIQNDMSEYQQLEEQVRQAQKMESIGTLVGGIAHDFNNMLAAIDGNLFLAESEPDNRQLIDHNLANIKRLSGRAADIVKQLLVYARKDMVSMKPLQLNGFMRDGLSLARSVIPENIEQKFDICDEELAIQGDATQLQQVLLNLLNNACHAVTGVDEPSIVCSLGHVQADEAFMRKHPQLRTRELARLTVSDNGCGISKQNLSKIIEPFFTTKGVGEGTGLGLSMVYGSVQHHAGAFEVESEPGKGSSFHIYLPLIAESVQPETPHPQGFAQGRGETILVVDDQPELLKTTSRVLDRLGYPVLQAADGEAALAIFAANRERIALVLTDIVMPRLGGTELMQRIWGTDPDIPVIYVTGYGDRYAEISAAEAGQSRLLSKPYSLTEISYTIRELLD